MHAAQTAIHDNVFHWEIVYLSLHMRAHTQRIYLSIKENIRLNLMSILWLRLDIRFSSAHRFGCPIDFSLVSLSQFVHVTQNRNICSLVQFFNVCACAFARTFYWWHFYFTISLNIQYFILACCRHRAAAPPPILPANSDTLYTNGFCQYLACVFPTTHAHIASSDLNNHE